MSNTHRIRVKDIATPVAQGLQLGVQCNVQPGPDGSPWAGLTFGMGPSTYTLGIPLGSVDQFLALVNGIMTEAVEKHNADQASKLILPSDVGQLLVPRES